MTNVQTRADFDLFLKDLKENEIKVFDFETNGLKPYNDNKIISMSVYFPAVDRSYNLPFRHGVGKIDIRYNDTHTEGTPFSDMNWQGNAKKDLYLQYWFNRFVHDADAGYFKNLPIEWLEEIKAVWGAGIYLGHNVRFDAHFAYTEGYPDMEMFYDTLIALHLVQEDWGGIELDAPYTYTGKDATAGKCSEDDVGTWAGAADGTLLTRKQPGRRGLKWQAARIGLTGATEGERGLHQARKDFEEQLTDFIIGHWDDPMNDSLFTKAMVNAMEAFNRGASRMLGTEIAKAQEGFNKARAKVRAKIEINDKAQMWMLPSDKVAHYAELDVILTWGLYQWCLPILQEWDNIELFERISSIHHKVAWEMERNGVKLNKDFAQEEIAKLEPMIEDLEYNINEMAKNYGLDGCNPNSPMQLLPLLNSGVLTKEFNPYYWPTWFPEDKKKDLKVYDRSYIGDYDLQEQYDPIEGTAKAELDKVADHGLVRLIKEHRMLKKSVDTYLMKWLRTADADDFVHGAFNTDGTVAGRMSSSGDAGNFQNIPDRNGYTIKRAFVSPGDEWLIGAFDYGQLELRLACWVAEVQLNLDPKHTMTNLFLADKDMHSYTRDQINVRSILYGDMSDEQIVTKLGYAANSKEMKEAADTVAERCRYVAKTMNFGLLYSGGAPMLMKLLKLDDVSVAKTLVTNWRNLYPAFPKANRYFTDLASTYRENPSGKKRLFVQQPLSGRFRKLDMYPKWKSYFKDGTWQGFNPQEAAQRKVWNNTIQGLGGYICTDAMLRFTEGFGTDKLSFFAQIHDADEFYFRRDNLGIVKELASIMVDYPIVPGLVVDFSCSTDGTWQGMTKVKDMNLWIASGATEGYKK